MPAQALTLKKGQIIGGDGNVHDGASPDASQLIKMPKNRFLNKKAAGVVGGNLFVIVEMTLFLSLTELAGKSKETNGSCQREHIVSHLVSNMTANILLKKVASTKRPWNNLNPWILRMMKSPTKLQMR